MFCSLARAHTGSLVHPHACHVNFRHIKPQTKGLAFPALLPVLWMVYFFLLGWPLGCLSSLWAVKPVPSLLHVVGVTSIQLSRLAVFGV